MSAPIAPATDGTTSPNDAALLLNVVTYPHRSLNSTGFLILMAALCGGSFIIGMVFFLSGAWPVVGFLGLDVLVVYVAFRMNYRAALAYETITLTPAALEVTQVDSRGRSRRSTFQPYWLAVEMDDPPRRASRLTLRSHGRSLEIARFLNSEEKAELARTLRHAIRQSRQPVSAINADQ
ncbi:hypothetical protein BAL199_11321 [alpha proteobacterium BAL199]|nr:hypothetical protein BAL199_11321 [alpha proteobacterium BAL199]